MAGTYDYRNMLSEVAEELEDKDAKVLAQILTIPVARRSRISNGTELIQEMERIKFVSQDDVEELLKLMESKNFAKAADIVRKYKETLHSGDLSTQKQSSFETATKSRSSENAPEKKEVDMKYFEELSGELGNDWMEVGRKLGFKDPELSNIESDSRSRQKEATYQMFRKWYEKNGSAATYEKLATALKKAGKGKLAEDVLKYAANH